MTYFTCHIKSSFAKKNLQIYVQCMWDSFFLVHAPEGVIEMVHLCTGKFK